MQLLLLRILSARINEGVSLSRPFLYFLPALAGLVLAAADLISMAIFLAAILLVTMTFLFFSTGIVTLQVFFGCGLVILHARYSLIQ